MQKPLTNRQRQLLTFVQSYTAHNGYPPSLREMAEHLGIRTVSTVHQHLKVLRSMGLIKIDSSERGRNTVARDAPRLIKIPLLGEVAAGLPIEPIEDPEPVFVSTDLVKSSTNHYALRVKGDSMIDDGIQDGDIVIVKAQNYVEYIGQTIVGVSDNAATLKKFGGITKDGHIKLIPRNPKMADMVVSRETFEVRGKLVGLVRSM